MARSPHLVGASLVYVALAVVNPGTCKAEEVSKAAREFIYGGSKFVLRRCSTILPPRSCPYGKLIRAGEEQRWVDENGRLVTFQSLEYEGMTLTVRSGGLVALSTSEPNWPAYRGIGVGVSLKRVLASLGRPTSRYSDGSPSYCYHVDEACVVFAVSREGVVKSVNWSFYFD